VGLGIRVAVAVGDGLGEANTVADGVATGAVVAEGATVVIRDGVAEGNSCANSALHAPNASNIAAQAIR
jgi:hypothetical protein